MKKIVFLFLIFILIGGCTMNFQKNKRLVPPFYKLDDAVLAVKNFESFESHTHGSKDEIPLHFVQVGDKSDHSVLFIHGSPGSWEAWAEYLHDSELRSKALMVAVDRPGYGGSDNGVSGTSLKDQARAIIESIQDRYPDQKKWIVVGHSYGGPVALRLAVDYPEAVSSALLLAPAISSKLVRVRWYNRIASLPLVRSLISTSLLRSNEEMYLLSDELLQMQPQLKQIKIPVDVIQGKKDGIVDPENVTFAKEELVNATVETNLLPQRGHFLVWEEYELVKKTLLKMLES